MNRKAKCSCAACGGLTDKVPGLKSTETLCGRCDDRFMAFGNSIGNDVYTDETLFDKFIKRCKPLGS